MAWNIAPAKKRPRNRVIPRVSIRLIRVPVEILLNETGEDKTEGRVVLQEIYGRLEIHLFSALNLQNSAKVMIKFPGLQVSAHVLGSKLSASPKVIGDLHEQNFAFQNVVEFISENEKIELEKLCKNLVTESWGSGFLPK